MAGRGLAWLGRARRDKADKAGLGPARRGEARRDKADKARPGQAWRGMAWLGKPDEARHGLARPGGARLGWAGDGAYRFNGPLSRSAVRRAVDDLGDLGASPPHGFALLLCQRVG